MPDNKYLIGTITIDGEDFNYVPQFGFMDDSGKITMNTDVSHTADYKIQFNCTNKPSSRKEFIEMLKEFIGILEYDVPMSLDFTPNLTYMFPVKYQHKICECGKCDNKEEKIKQLW